MVCKNSATCKIVRRTKMFGTCRGNLEAARFGQQQNRAYTVKKLLRNTFNFADGIFDVCKILQNFFDLAAKLLQSRYSCKKTTTCYRKPNLAASKLP